MLNLVANGPSGYNLTNSLRFRSSASAYLSRTPASAGNQKTWTWSSWVKRGALGTRNGLFGSVDTYIEFIASDVIEINLRAAATNYIWTTTQVFRDPSAWYHIVLAVDTTQATATDRMKLYVNGSQVTSFASSATIPQNTDTRVNSTALHTIGSYNASTDYLDGYQTEVNFVNAQQLTPSSFGNINSITGVWQPAKYTGTYGTNGFYLNFSDIATTSGSNAGLGKDFSGNGNYLTTNNISVTAGSTYDAMTDVPTLTSATVANYATLNPLKMPAPASASYTNGNLSVSVATANQTPALATIYPSSGKWYWEVTWTSGSYARLGVQNTTVASTDFAADVYGWRYGSDGQIYSGSLIMTVATYAAGDVIGFCLDCDAGKLYVSKNGTWQNSAVPASGTGAVVTNIPTNTPISPAVATGSLTSVFALNFGQQPFSYTPPTGFVRLNTYNLPDSTIKKGSTVMDATTYTGTGASLSVTNAGAFKPDFVWVKGRSGATDHALYDSVRGTTIDLVSNSTAAETTQAQGLTAFGTGGFTVGTLAKMNTSSATYVGWQWQAGQGTTSSNTSGSITSTVSVNTTAGFSIVTFNAGSSGNQTVGHGLGVAPKMVILKDRANAVGWFVYLPFVMAVTQYMTLNSTLAITSTTNVWGASAPTSSVFGFTSGACITPNANGVAYCWAEIAGFSKFGSYTGNGSTDGPFVYTGFRPKFVILKNTSAVGGWVILDTSRNTYNVAGNELYPNSSAAEGTGYTDADFLSNGFKLRVASDPNASSGAYIYMAFAENPFKNSNAR